MIWKIRQYSHRIELSLEALEMPIMPVSLPLYSVPDQMRRVASNVRTPGAMPCPRLGIDNPSSRILRPGLSGKPRSPCQASYSVSPRLSSRLTSPFGLLSISSCWACSPQSVGISTSASESQGDAGAGHSRGSALPATWWKPSLYSISFSWPWPACGLAVAIRRDYF